MNKDIPESCDLSPFNIELYSFYLVFAWPQLLLVFVGYNWGLFLLGDKAKSNRWGQAPTNSY